MKVASVPGVKISGLIFDAGPVNSPVLLEVGTPNAHNSDPADPTLLSDVFFRIGGATAGKATVSLVVNSDNVIIDDIWAWRADHGNGVGWTSNTADTGVIVNGDNVTAYGLFPFAAPLKKYSCPYLEVTHELAGGSFGNKTQRELGELVKQLRDRLPEPSPRATWAATQAANSILLDNGSPPNSPAPYAP
jgi:hypothetical protein